MKPHSHLLFCVLALLGLATQGWAQAPKPDETQHTPAFAVMTDLRCVSLPRTRAIPIVRRLRSTKAEEVQKAVAELDDLVASGEAKLAGWPMITTFSGEKGTSEGIEEIRYATEFQPVVSNVYLSDSSDLQQKTPATKSDFEPTASAFETRNTGATLEIEPSFMDPEGKTVGLSFVAQYVRLLAIERVTVERQSMPENRSSKTIVEQPRFLTIRVQTTMAFSNGEQKLISVTPLPGGDEVVLMILGAEISKTKL